MTTAIHPDEDPMSMAGAVLPDVPLVEVEKHPFDTTNWTMLRRQKRALVRVQHTRKVDDKDYELLEGLVNFLDAIQDHASDIGYPVYPAYRDGTFSRLKRARSQGRQASRQGRR